MPAYWMGRVMHSDQIKNNAPPILIDGAKRRFDLLKSGIGPGSPLRRGSNHKATAVREGRGSSRSRSQHLIARDLAVAPDH